MSELALTYGGFAAFALLATLAQNATGFAFTLVLLGLSGVQGRVPLADAANAASLLTLAQAGLQVASARRAAALHGTATAPATPPEGAGPTGRWLGPLLVGSVPGLLAGVGLLAVLGGRAQPLLLGGLGAVVLACAVRMARPLPRSAQLSSTPVLCATGALSGLLGGLFATAGPPLVLQMYRQPLPFQVLRRGLLQVFALQAALRLALVAASGGLHPAGFWLASAALPAVAGAQLLSQRGGWPREAAQVRGLVVALLVATGVSLGWRAAGGVAQALAVAAG